MGELLTAPSARTRRQPPSKWLAFLGRRRPACAVGFPGGRHGGRLHYQTHLTVLGQCWFFGHLGYGGVGDIGDFGERRREGIVDDPCLGMKWRRSHRGRFGCGVSAASPRFALANTLITSSSESSLAPPFARDLLGLDRDQRRTYGQRSQLISPSLGQVDRSWDLSSPLHKRYARRPKPDTETYIEKCDKAGWRPRCFDDSCCVR